MKEENISQTEALVVIDVQNAFVSGSSAVPDHARLISAVDLLLDKARIAKCPVIFLQNDGPPDTIDAPFTWGWNLFFSPLLEEYVIRKQTDNGFEGTSLYATLTKLEIRKIIICGLLSEMCLAATAKAALEYGFDVLLPHDAHATYDVPAGPGSEGVPAAMAARAAEWSLGDEIQICASAYDVVFVSNSSE
ncbi:isochorismatase family protein [Sphingobacterium detergens]|uniref:Nicotinamidase-related amidase n=1 Tax=Sphingobacterium detergens TaxID=1145106 RepID=A0A420BH67_SPHD1|nr:isochorismatase family protein [Sphingobacterium detergens]RKE56081.1 nicotinamidase-related amidase [Sphingobacterium detergens]